MDRIALTLHKANETYLGEYAIFFSAWLKFKSDFNQMMVKKNFCMILSNEKKSVGVAVSTREKILHDAELSADIAGREFWYGIKGHSSLKNIQNIDAAKITLDLFCTYFENSFMITREIEPLFMEMYKTKYTKKVDKWLKEQNLNEISIVTKYVPPIYTGETNNNDFTKNIEAKQKEYVQLILQNHKSHQHEFWNYSGQQIADDYLQCADSITQEETIEYIDKIRNVLKNKRVMLRTIDEYLIQLTTAMMISREWDIKILNISLGLLKDLSGLIWFRDKLQEKDIFKLLDILDKILKNDPSIIHIGEGWPIGVLIEDGYDRRPAIVYSMNPNYSLYLGHQYVRTVITKLSPNEVEELISMSRNITASYWERIESRVKIDRTTRKNRNIFWKELNNERSKVVANN